MWERVGHDTISASSTLMARNFYSNYCDHHFSFFLSLFLSPLNCALKIVWIQILGDDDGKCGRNFYSLCCMKTKWLVNEENVRGCRKNDVYDGTFWTLEKTHEYPQRCDCVAIQTNGQIFLSLFSLALFIINALLCLSCGTGRINWIAVHTSLSLLPCLLHDDNINTDNEDKLETSVPPFDIIFNYPKIIILKFSSHTRTHNPNLMSIFKIIKHR